MRQLLACVITEEILCFEKENPKVILLRKREYGTLAHSIKQLNILAEQVALEMLLYVENISSDFRDKSYLNFFLFASLFSTPISFSSVNKKILLRILACISMSYGKYCEPVIECNAMCVNNPRCTVVRSNSMPELG